MSDEKSKAKLLLDLQHYDANNSPFLELKTPFTYWEALKMVLLIWFVPLRLIVGISAVLVLALLSFIAAYKQDISKPLIPWRRKLVIFSSNFAGLVALALGFRIKVNGYKNYLKARQLGAMGIFNHSAWVDSILLMYLFAPSGVSLANNADIPLVGTCIKAFQNIYVPRSSHGSAEKVIRARRAGDPYKATVSDLIAERAKDRRFPMLVAAPEGTCSDGRSILQFRSGCFLAGVPLLPILFNYAKRHHNPAWTIIHEAWHFLRMVCQFSNFVEITILPPYVPTKQETANPRLFAANVRKLFADTLRLPLLDQSVQHYAALSRAGVHVSLDGRSVRGPDGVLDSNGFANLTLHLQGKTHKA